MPNGVGNNTHRVGVMRFGENESAQSCAVHGEHATNCWLGVTALSMMCTEHNKIPQVLKAKGDFLEGDHRRSQSSGVVLGSVLMSV